MRQRNPSDKGPCMAHKPQFAEQIRRMRGNQHRKHVLASLIIFSWLAHECWGKMELPTRCPERTRSPSRDVTSCVCRESGDETDERRLDGTELSSWKYEKNPRFRLQSHGQLTATSKYDAVAHVDIRDAPGPILKTGCIPMLTYEGSLPSRKPSQGDIK